MFMRPVMVLLAGTLLYLPALCGAEGTATPPAAGAQSAAAAVQPTAAGDDVASLRHTLQEKRTELAKLRHKWTVKKGRTPTEKEIKEFEKKLAAGKATYQDNPFVNRSPFQVVGAAREAYYKKLAEVRALEERLKAVEGGESVTENGGR